MNNLNGFTNLFKQTKTLKFGLNPIGNTLKTINDYSYLEFDNNLYVESTKIKELINGYINDFIVEPKLQNVSSIEGLHELIEKINNKEVNSKNPEDIEKNFIKSVFGSLKLSAKTCMDELLKLDDLPSESKEILNMYKGRTVYFGDFVTNRKNLFEKNSLIQGSILYRTFRENLPKFIQNISVFNSLNNRLDINELEEYFNIKLEDLFCENGFVKCISQSGITLYNSIIEGVANGQLNTSIKGLNSIINEYNQVNSDKIKLFTPLFKQIASEKKTISFVEEKYSCDLECIEDCLNLFNNYKEYMECAVNLLKNITDYSNIYISNIKTNITDLSNYIYGDWSLIESRLTDKLEKGKDYSLVELGVSDLSNIVSRLYTDYRVEADHIYQSLENAKTHHIKEDANLRKNLKNYFNNLLDFVKVFKLFESSNEYGNAEFYNEYSNLLSALNTIYKIHHKVQSYITAKPYSEKKIPLNLGYSQLLNGWSCTNELKFGGQLFKANDNEYYLVVINKAYSKYFNSFEYDNPLNENDCIKKVRYYQAPPKVIPTLVRINGRVESKKKGIDELRKKYWDSDVLNVFEKKNKK